MSKNDDSVTLCNAYLGIFLFILSGFFGYVGIYQIFHGITLLLGSIKVILAGVCLWAGVFMSFGR